MAATPGRTPWGARSSLPEGPGHTLVGGVRDLWPSFAQGMLKSPAPPPPPTGNWKPYLEEFEIPVVHRCAHSHLVPLRERHRGQDVGPVVKEPVDLRRTGPRQIRVTTQASRRQDPEQGRPSPQQPLAVIWATQGCQALLPTSLEGGGQLRSQTPAEEQALPRHAVVTCISPGRPPLRCVERHKLDRRAASRTRG